MTTGYRLRFVTGVTLTAATYGSGTYGAGTYGEQASDPLGSLHYTLVPIPAGYLVDPAWTYRHGDTGGTWRAEVTSDSGPIDLEAVAGAQLVLTPHDGRPVVSLLFPLDRLDNGIIEHVWQPGELATPGAYRVVVVLTFLSGRQLTVPGDDNVRLVITS